MLALKNIEKSMIHFQWYTKCSRYTCQMKVIKVAKPLQQLRLCDRTVMCACVCMCKYC